MVTYRNLGGGVEQTTNPCILIEVKPDGALAVRSMKDGKCDALFGETNDKEKSLSFASAALVELLLKNGVSVG